MGTFKNGTLREKISRCFLCPSSIRYRDSNPRPSDRESLPITTRPGLQPSYRDVLRCIPNMIYSIHPFACHGPNNILNLFFDENLRRLLDGMFSERKKKAFFKARRIIFIVRQIFFAVAFDFLSLCLHLKC